MSGVATAIAGAAVVGAVSSNNASKKAAKASEKSAATAAKETRRAADEARADVNKLFPQAQIAGQRGFQAALDVFGQSVPAQQQAFQGGNVAAQQQILNGLPQIQNALFGNQVDLSQLQAYQAPQQDYSFLQQQLPKFGDSYAQEQPPVKPDIGYLLGGGGTVRPGDLGGASVDGNNGFGAGWGSAGSNRFFDQSNNLFNRLNLR